MLTSTEIASKYGTAGDSARLTSITLPYPMELAWVPGQMVNKITCNKGIAKQLLQVFNDILAHYGLEKIKALGIDQFGGCVNVRPQRGLEAKYAALMKAGKVSEAQKYLSRHSWGVAIDLDPLRNTLKETSKTARFARPEYKAMNDIFYKNGFIGYGRERNNDWMHYEIAK